MRAIPRIKRESCGRRLLASVYPVVSPFGWLRIDQVVDSSAFVGGSTESLGCDDDDGMQPLPGHTSILIRWRRGRAIECTKPGESRIFGATLRRAFVLRGRVCSGRRRRAKSQILSNSIPDNETTLTRSASTSRVRRR